MKNNDIAIRVNNLSKHYFIGHETNNYRTFRETLVAALKSPFIKSRDLFRGKAHAATNLKEEFWALKEISFEIKKGDVVGFIGHNGAGKSTLLKILSRITEPTKGSVEIFGRVASLLEVGTGFHPELTGRENIYLNGAILGMRRDEIRKKFDEIVAFSGVEQFLDTPVKHYSSGMYVRLAFSVAAHLESEILIIDEVLAVGDAEFQKKCLGKMNDVAKDGRTVLFVSHNLTAIKKLCNKAVWLSKGTLITTGSVSDVSSDYMKNVFSNTGNQIWEGKKKPQVEGIVELNAISVATASGSEIISMIDDFEIQLEFRSLDSERDLHFTFHILTEDGITAFTFGSKKKRFNIGTHKIRFEIPKNLLNEGRFIANLLIIENGVTLLKLFDSILVFSIQDATERRFDYTGKEPGIFSPMIKSETKEVTLD